MLLTWPVTSSPKNCWHKSVWPHANTMGRAAGHTLVLKEERKALIRPSLLGLSPQIVAATSCYSEATDVYEQVRVIARPMDGPGIWHKPTGRVHSTRTGRGARVLPEYSFLPTVDKRRQEAGERDAVNCFFGLFCKWSFFLWYLQLSQLKWLYSQHLHPTAKEVPRFLSWLENNLAESGSVAYCLRQPSVHPAHTFLTARGTRD